MIDSFVSTSYRSRVLDRRRRRIFSYLSSHRNSLIRRGRKVQKVEDEKGEWKRVERVQRAGQLDRRVEERKKVHEEAFEVVEGSEAVEGSEVVEGFGLERWVFAKKLGELRSIEVGQVEQEVDRKQSKDSWLKEVQKLREREESGKEDNSKAGRLTED